MEFQLRKRSECCRRPSVIWPCRRKMFTSGTKTSKKAENALMTWNTPDDHQQQLTSNTSIKSKNSCTKIVNWQLETLLRLLSFQEDHSTPFQKIFWADNSWFLHHDNAPSHTPLVLRDHFGKNSTHIVPQPPYSPDLAPRDFWLFPKLKRPLRGHRFDTIEEIQAESKKAWRLWRQFRKSNLTSISTKMYLRYPYGPDSIRIKSTLLVIIIYCLLLPSVLIFASVWLCHNLFKPA